MGQLETSKMIVGILLGTALLTTSCTARLTDFTVISSKNIQLTGVVKGKRVTGSSCGPLGLGASVKSAMDEAIESAGVNAGDMLVDGVVTSTTYLGLISCYGVTGTIASSSGGHAKIYDDTWPGVGRFDVALRSSMPPMGPTK